MRHVTVISLEVVSSNPGGVRAEIVLAEPVTEPDPTVQP